MGKNQKRLSAYADRGLFFKTIQAKLESLWYKIPDSSFANIVADADDVIPKGSQLPARRKHIFKNLLPKNNNILFNLRTKSITASLNDESKVKMLIKFALMRNSNNTVRLKVKAQIYFKSFSRYLMLFKFVASKVQICL